MIPQLKSPPRVRVEWLIAAARVVLAFGTLLATAINPEAMARPTAYFLGWYSVYSLTLLALVWTPVRFARGWDIIVHVVDMAAFAAWFFLVDGVTNAMVVYYLFVLICATIRWHSVGTMWTAAAAVSLQAAIGLYVHRLGVAPTASLDVATRSVYMLLIAVLVAYLGTHQDRFQYEISRLASWPRKPTKDPRELVSEIIRQSSEFLRAPRTVLVWEEPGEGWVNVAWQGEYDVMWTQEPEATYGSFVLPGLEPASFQADDAAVEGRVMLLRSSGFRRRRCRPVNEALRARFNMSAVQSWPLNGELLRGRMFCLDQVRMRLDDLILGEVVAWLAVTRLESHYWQERLREAAALDERVRLARDLHDSLLQSQTGVALQLVAARRQLDRDPAVGKQRLADVQQQLEQDELELRSFVSRLRPANRPVGRPAAVSLAERLDELRQRVERQWEIHVRLQLDAIDGLPDELLEGTYRLAQESVVNAARHADASVIDVQVTRADGHLQLRIVDDGRGFPFQGTYDLAALNGMNQGPLTLKERVADLGGALTLVSAESGTELLITLPLTRVPV
ncbi:MAG TPA: sensor histidine kinase [Vicinamibacterales bacterium]|nr:sensor histidine kinase [Vicinamibacterales bacterium]